MTSSLAVRLFPVTKGVFLYKKVVNVASDSALLTTVRVHKLYLLTYLFTLKLRFRVMVSRFWALLGQ